MFQGGWRVGGGKDSRWAGGEQEMESGAADPSPDSSQVPRQHGSAH